MRQSGLRGLRTKIFEHGKLRPQRQHVQIRAHCATRKANTKSPHRKRGSPHEAPSRKGAESRHILVSQTRGRHAAHVEECTPHHRKDRIALQFARGANFAHRRRGDDHNAPRSTPAPHGPDTAFVLFFCAFSFFFSRSIFFIYLY